MASLGESLLLQGCWCCLWPPSQCFHPGSSSSSPDLSQGWRILSKKPHICRLRVPWSREGHCRACWLPPRLGWLEGGALWEEREHPRAPGSSQTFQLQAQFLHIPAVDLCAWSSTRTTDILDQGRAVLFCLILCHQCSYFHSQVSPKVQGEHPILAGGWLIPVWATSTIPRNCWAARGPWTKNLFLSQLLA